MGDVVVSKFGGSSLSDSLQFKKVKDIVLGDENRRYVIPSAPGKRNDEDYKITNLLYLCYEQAKEDEDFEGIFSLVRERYTNLCSELDISMDINSYLDDIKKEIWNGISSDYVESRGEYLNGLVLAKYLNFSFIDPTEVIIFNKNGELNEEITYQRIKDRLGEIDRAVIPGYYGATLEGRVKTFSRGGSDITGAIIAKGISAKIYENWTDVSGLLMADPRIVTDPKSIEVVTYKELRELAYMGASVFHEEATFPVMREKIPINIKNTNRPLDRGTLIVDEDMKESEGIIGVSGKKNFTIITIYKTLMSRDRGYCRRLLSVLERRNIGFEHIPSGVDSISIVIENSDTRETLEDVLKEMRERCNPDSLIVYESLSLISIVGKGIINTQGIACKLFTALNDANINVRMISQGSSNLSIVIGVESEDFEAAIRAIYYAFEN